MEKTCCLSYCNGCVDDYKEFLAQNILYIGLPELFGRGIDLHRDLTRMNLFKTNTEPVLINFTDSFTLIKFFFSEKP